MSPLGKDGIKFVLDTVQRLSKRALAFLRVLVELRDRERVVRTFVASDDAEDELPDPGSGINSIRDQKILSCRILGRNFNNAKTMGPLRIN